MIVSSVKLTAYVKRPPAASLGGLGVLGSRLGSSLEFGLGLGLIDVAVYQWGQWSC